MNSSDIVNVIKKYRLKNDRYAIISGAACVLHGVKEETHDIDISVDKDYFNELLNKYNCALENKETNAYMIDDIINFGTGYFPNEIVLIDNLPVSSIEDIIALKENLNREKDLRDLKLIRRKLNEKN